MSTSFAPIVLFAYNRPIHIKKVLEALALNIEAKDSLLYIYCDGAKENVSEVTNQKIIETRTTVNLENRFLKVIIKEHKKNKGLANSIIDGVTEIVNKYGTIIVLEDDIVPSPGFLKYMNDALKLYFNEPQVGCIHAWNYNLNVGNYTESTFFLKGADCWGWATWKRAWDEFNPDGKELLETLESKKLEFEFNRKNTHSFIEMLKNQIEGKNDSWAIRWHASLFLKNMYCLHPTRPIVKNIGLDNTGVHCGTSDLKQTPTSFIEINKIPIKESEWFFTAYAEFLKKKSSFNKIKMAKIKNILKALIPPILFLVIRHLKKQPSSPEGWAGDYATWAEARIHSTGYDSDLILEKCKSALLKVKNGEAVYERDSVLFDKIQYSWGLLAGLQRAALENDGKLCVLDFGGSLGSSYYQNKGFLNSLKELQWCIVEQPHFVSCGKEFFEDDQLKFFGTIEECIGKYKPNVLLLSSVLQYLEKPYEVIEKLVGLNFPYIIIDRTSFIETDNDILTIQNVSESIYPASYPAWFFNYQHFAKYFTCYYNLILNFDDCFTVKILLMGKICSWEGMILRKK